MLELVPDVNIEGHVRLIVSVMRSDDWIDFWNDLELQIRTFSQLGLAENSPDDLVWRATAGSDAILITGNRNDDVPNSLESMLRSPEAHSKYPVITLSDPERIKYDREYLHRVVSSLYEYLYDIESSRGAGRRYIPINRP